MSADKWPVESQLANPELGRRVGYTQRLGSVALVGAEGAAQAAGNFFAGTMAELVGAPAVRPLVAVHEPHMPLVAGEELMTAVADLQPVPPRVWANRQPVSQLALAA
jgi:hypothetical protein